MFYSRVMMPFMCALLTSQAEPRTGASSAAAAGGRRYKPIIQVTEEIDINDITFTTSTPEFERASSYKAVAHYKPEGPTKGSFVRLQDVPPNAFPPVHYKDSYGTIVPLEKLYAVPSVKYKPYKVLKVQDGYRPVSYKPRIHDKSKFVTFDPVGTFGGPETSKQKLAPFSTRPPVKTTTRTTGFLPQENKNFVPSPTFSPTVLALINSENHKFSERPDVNSFPSQTPTADWPKPGPKIVKTGRKIPDSNPRESNGGDFTRATETLEENLNHRSPPSYKESPQQSESFLDGDLVHKGTANHLDEVADSLDLKTGERVEFQMYGMDGPQSYKFGFDTGKGHNRHFRFEERDNTGKVKGHYGYLDEDGKMRIMKYEADPITGFHAGPVEFSPDDN